jgi:diketogulonate reductase-like aldo/keto reductase
MNESLLISSEIDRSPIESDANQLSLVVKVFLYSESESGLEEAIRAVLSHSSRTAADSVIVALPPQQKDNRAVDQLLQMWLKVEKAGQQRLATEFGVSDLSLDELKVIAEQAQHIRPSTNHINLEYCCTISPEMSEFAESNHIRLVTHNDPKGA